MEPKQLLLFLSILLLSSCSFHEAASVLNEYEKTEKHNFSSILALQSRELADIKAPEVQPVVAVYPSSFTDQTGQRKGNGEFALDGLHLGNLNSSSPFNPFDSALDNISS